MNQPILKYVCIVLGFILANASILHANDTIKYPRQNPQISIYAGISNYIDKLENSSLLNKIPDGGAEISFKTSKKHKFGFGLAAGIRKHSHYMEYPEENHGSGRDYQTLETYGFYAGPQISAYFGNNRSCSFEISPFIFIPAYFSRVNVYYYYDNIYNYSVPHNYDSKVEKSKNSLSPMLFGGVSLSISKQFILKRNKITLFVASRRIFIKPENDYDYQEIFGVKIPKFDTYEVHGGMRFSLSSGQQKPAYNEYFADIKSGLHPEKYYTLGMYQLNQPSEPKNTILSNEFYSSEGCNVFLELGSNKNQLGIGFQRSLIIMHHTFPEKTNSGKSFKFKFYNKDLILSYRHYVPVGNKSPSS